MTDTTSALTPEEALMVENYAMGPGENAPKEVREQYQAALERQKTEGAVALYEGE